MKENAKKGKKEQKQLEQPQLNTIITSVLYSYVDSTMEEGESITVAKLKKELEIEENKFPHLNTLRKYLLRAMNDSEYNHIVETLIDRKQKIIGIKKRNSHLK